LPKKAVLTVRQVDVHSPAEKAGLLSGDIITEVNGHPVDDAIDFQFYASEAKLKLRLNRKGKNKKTKLKRKEGQWLGLEFEPMDCMACGNNCIFCFVDQNAKGLRETLYFKDEDYRHSFLYGNYVTLTRMSDADIQRVITQRLSPLYISVHATASEVRKQLLGIKRDDQLLDKLTTLSEGGIELHAQIVLCRGINDGAVLEQTLNDLVRLHPSVKSVAIVPVGLTAHRAHLPKLDAYDAAACKDVLDQAERLQAAFVKELGTPFAFFADEFYLRAGRPLPDEAHYEGFWQIENGVGMMRDFLSRFEADAGDFPPALETPKKIALVSGKLAGPVLDASVLPVLNAVDGLEAVLTAPENSLLGPSVTVSGLLPGKDYLNAARSLLPADLVVLPINCVNTDGLFLDDLSLDQLEAELKTPVVLMDTFSDLWDLL